MVSCNVPFQPRWLPIRALISAAKEQQVHMQEEGKLYFKGKH